MKWVIEILADRLRQMNDAYEKYVLNGNVKTNSPNAIENREKAEQISNAIKILSTAVDTSERQLTIPGVIKSVCGDCLYYLTCNHESRDKQICDNYDKEP